MSVGEDWTIPEARFDDLDLDDPAGWAVWEQRLAAMAARRILQARARLEKMGIIDRDGNGVSAEVPADMRPGSESGVDTR